MWWGPLACQGPAPRLQRCVEEATSPYRPAQGLRELTKRSGKLRIYQDKRSVGYNACDGCLETRHSQQSRGYSYAASGYPLEGRH
jgi:hypothetical protein